MQTTLLITLLVSGILILIVAVLWTIVQIVRLRQQNQKKNQDLEKVLDKETTERLRADANARYEAVMTRELKRFEKELEQTSNELLSQIHKRLAAPDQQLDATIQALLAQTMSGYSSVLSVSTAQLKEQLASVEQQVVAQQKVVEAAAGEVIAARKTAALARIETDLADIFARYLASIVGSLDFADQQAVILEQLAKIKPQLEEDVKRAY